MKDNTQLTSYLNEYLKMNSPQFAVMITGKWGCGKTFYIKNRIEEWSKDKIKTGEESIALKPIYISVNGLNTITAVVRKIKTVLYPVLYSKGAQVAKKVAFTALQILTKSKMDLDGDGTGEDLNSLLDAEGILEIFKSDSDTIKGNRVLVIDDVERCKIPLDELFGFVNGIVEHSNSKVILVCDEDKLSEVAEKENLSVQYKSFKEKLVGQTFALAVDYASVASSFINAKKSTAITNNKALIVELFVASKCKNLRLMRHCLIDVERFFEQLPKNVEKNSNYKSFVTNVVAYIVITSLECRYGNEKIQHYQSYSFGEKEKAAARELETKYNAILERHQLYNSMYTIPISYLIGFIQNGYLESPAYVLSGCRMLRSHSMTDWEKLWRCNRLENDEFIRILNQEKKRFFGKKLEYVFEVAHLAGILLSLEKRGLVKLSRNHVVSVAKANMREIFGKYPEDVSRTMLNSQGYEFQEHGTAEMNAILSYAHQLYDSKVKQTEEAYIKSVWEKLVAGVTCNELEKIFDEVTPTRRCSYAMESIFVQVPAKVMVEKIAVLPNATKIEFATFLVHRYYLEGSGIIASVRDEMKKDKDALERISAGLKSKAKRQKLIDKEMTLEVSKKIDEAVLKMS